MDDKLKLKLVENRRRVEEEYRKNRVRFRPDILRQKAGPAAAVNKELDLKLKLMENRRRVQEEYMKNRRADILRRQKSGPAGDKFTSKPKPAGNKRKAPEHAHAPARKKLDDHFWNHFCDRAYAPVPSRPRSIMEHYIFLFEFALGYALFDAREMNLHPGVVTTFKIAEKYLNNNPFTLRAFYPFPSPGDALVQMKAICTSTVTKELKSFIADNIPEPSSGYVLAVSTPRLVETLGSAARKKCIAGQVTDHVMRGLRVKIDKLIVGLENEDDRTEVEYRVWNPHVSKLAAAVQGGVTNIWVKPGSHVLYLGNVCGITVLQLSDLVGSDGLVYVIGSVANTVKERSNIVTLLENYNFRMGKEYFCNGGSSDFRWIRGMDYGMVIGMVDVILGDIIYSSGPTFQLGYICRYAQLHLKTGGHYLVSTRPENNNLTSQVKDPFADETFPCTMRMEFETNELVMLEPIGRGHAMVVGSYRLK